MIVFPNAKINIGLSVTEKRADGFHNLETIFYPLRLSDTLEVLENTELERGDYRISSYGIQVDCKAEDNIIVKAYKLLAADYDIPGVDIYFHKRIPFGAGLGGGSADAAFMLKLINEMFGLGISESGLEDYAARLGSDCAFFVRNRPVFAYGRGELFKPIELNLDGYYIVLVKPEIAVSTALAYSGITPMKSSFDLKGLSEKEIVSWKDYVLNDFEKSIFPKYEEIEKIKKTLYSEGAVYASMSGSGASVYGIFTEKINIQDKFKDCFYWSDYL